MAERKLATIRIVGPIHDIPKKDRIGLAEIDGWTVIVQKSEFKEGDLCVYCEIDSVLPQKEEFAFLEKVNYRIKTMKMAGCISQGICFPLTILPKGDYKLGDDVTEILGVTKWERPDSGDSYKPTQRQEKHHYPKFLMRMKWFRKLVLGKEHDTNFPTFISKTDETRIQNAPWLLEKDTTWVVTEKVDGQSGTFIVKRKKGFLGEKREYIVCSRNCRLWKPDSTSYWSVSEKYQLEKVLNGILDERKDCEWVAIQGECVGPGVQGNKYKFSSHKLFVFNFITSADGRWGSIDAEKLMDTLGIPFVPIIDTNAKLPTDVQAMVDLAHGDSQLADIYREGLVCRTADGKTSFKAVDPLFLLKYDE